MLPAVPLAKTGGHVRAVGSSSANMVCEVTSSSNVTSAAGVLDLGWRQGLGGQPCCNRCAPAVCMNGHDQHC